MISVGLSECEDLKNGSVNALCGLFQAVLGLKQGLRAERPYSRKTGPWKGKEGYMLLGWGFLLFE